MLKINEWYIQNVILNTEGLKYIPSVYHLTIIDDSDIRYTTCKIEFDDIEFNYDVPKTQIIEEEF